MAGCGLTVSRSSCEQREIAPEDLGSSKSYQIFQCSLLIYYLTETPASSFDLLEHLMGLTL